METAQRDASGCDCRMKQVETETHTLSVRLWNTEKCKSIAAELCEFENQVFGPDFSCPVESVQSWFDSGCLFSATMCGEAVAGHERVLSAISALVTDESSRDKLLRGEILDTELVPWSLSKPGTQPCIYFASVISDNPTHLSRMYQSVGEDMGRFLSLNQLHPMTAFAVASGEAGQKHMVRNGFQPCGRLYLKKYAIMLMDQTTAKTQFWHRLLGSMPMAHRDLQPTVENVSRGNGLPVESNEVSSLVLRPNESVTEFLKRTSTKVSY